MGHGSLVLELQVHLAILILLGNVAGATTR